MTTRETTKEMPRVDEPRDDDPRGPVDPRTGLRGRPESPSDSFGQQTRDNVNPNIPSAEPGAPPKTEGVLVDPTSLGMEQGGVAPREVPVRSADEPMIPTGQSGEPPVWPYVGIDPAHPLNTPVSINEPPGSDVSGGAGEGGGTPNPDEAPEIESLDPDEAEVGSADVTLHVHGSGFAQGSVIQFNAADMETAFVSETELTCEVKPSAWTDGVVPVRVKNGDGGLKSEPVEFEFTNPEEPAATRTSKRTKPAPKKKKGR